MAHMGEQMKRTPFRHHVLAVCGLACVLGLVLPHSGAATEGRRPGLTVMTRNLYLGADLVPLATAADLDELARAGSAIWAQVQATNFPERARALAREVLEADPVLVGLQAGGPKLRLAIYHQLALS